MSDLDDYKTDHLILLVGSNPLPNYVAAQLLWRKTKSESCLILIHSDDTYLAAKRLQCLLIKQNPNLDKENDFRLILVEEANADDIHAKLSKIVEYVPFGDVGLNYTGGTKVMAVHAHHAVRDSLENRRLVCSYLDARSYEMRFDPPHQIANKKVLTKVAR